MGRDSNPPAHRFRAPQYAKKAPISDPHPPCREPPRVPSPLLLHLLGTIESPCLVASLKVLVACTFPAITVRYPPSFIFVAIVVMFRGIPAPVPTCIDTHVRTAPYSQVCTESELGPVVQDRHLSSRMHCRWWGRR